MQNLAQIAINAALCNDWKKAIEANQSILKDTPNDIDALSRLAFAQTQTGKIEKAKKNYNKILTLDPFNQIAKKNLDKIVALPKTGNKHKNYTKTNISPDLFIEEPGKTKTVILKNVAPLTVLSKLQTGNMVVLCPKKRTVEVRDQEKTYLGVLPDDIAFRLIPLLKAGNEYESCVKNVEKNCVSLFIKQVKQAKKYSKQPSFVSSDKNYQLSTSKIIIKKLKMQEKSQDESEE